MNSEESGSFKSIVLEEFDFLESKYDFVVEIISSGHVKYKSSCVTLSVLYDNRRSFELDLEVGKEDEARSFSFTEIAKVLEFQSELATYTPSLISDLGLKAYLESFARALKDKGSQLLQGNKFIFSRLENQRVTDCEEYALSTALSQARVDSREAWKAKNYIAVVQILSPYVAHLNSSEQKKLDYAKKHR